jgi:hypothetical protein
MPTQVKADFSVRRRSLSRTRAGASPSRDDLDETDRIRFGSEVPRSIWDRLELRLWIAACR